MAVAVCVTALATASAALGPVVGEHAGNFFDQTAKNWSRCAEDSASPDTRIESCSALIHSPRARKQVKLAGAYYQRGRAFQEKGDRDSAIADLYSAFRHDTKLQRAICTFSRQNDLRLGFCPATKDLRDDDKDHLGRRASTP